MTQFNFGIGNIYGFPVGGGAPRIFGTISGASLDISGDIKMLYGQNQFPDDVSVGKRKITGKISVGLVDTNLMSQIYFGGAPVAGRLLEALAEPHSVPAASTYTVTSTNAATYNADCGVYYASSGLPLVQVAAGSEAAGMYSVNLTTGVYTFAAADEGKAILLNYTYGDTVNGLSLSVGQTLMGQIQTFQLLLLNITKGNTFGFTLYSCVSDKLSLPIKQDDYMEVEFDFAAFADPAKRVLKIWNS